MLVFERCRPFSRVLLQNVQTLSLLLLATGKCFNIMGFAHESDFSNSQGAALVHRAIEDLSDSVKAKIVGVVTYGDTQNTQDLGRIPNFPTNKLKIICNVGDAVCLGTLTILSPHLDYVRRVPEAVSFLTGKLKAAGA